MKRLFLLVLVAGAIAGALAAYLSRPVRVPEAAGTWQPAEHEPATH